jgi:hypothetical protein
LQEQWTLSVGHEKRLVAARPNRADTHYANGDVHKFVAIEQGAPVIGEGQTVVGEEMPDHRLILLILVRARQRDVIHERRNVLDTHPADVLER